MRKLFLLIALLLTSFVFSQKPNFQKLDSIQFKMNCDKIIKDTGKSFKFVKVDKIETKEYIKYVDENNSESALYIIFYSYMDGANKDLEIKGTKKWNIDSIASKYLLVYDLYKNYFNPKADKEKIQSMGMEYDRNQHEASLRKTSQEGLWEIKLFL